MSRDLNGDIVEVVLVKVCISEVDSLKFRKPFSFRSLSLSACVSLVPEQSQVHQAGAVVTQGTHLDSLELGEVDADQGLAVPGEDGGEDLKEEAGVREVGVVLAEVQLPEMIHVKKAETRGRGDEICQHDVDVLHLGTQGHSHSQALVTAETGFVKGLYCTSVHSPAALTGVQRSEPESRVWRKLNIHH